jgi:hypothetical protein
VCVCVCSVGQGDDFAEAGGADSQERLFSSVFAKLNVDDAKAQDDQQGKVKSRGGARANAGRPAKQPGAIVAQAGKKKKGAVAAVSSSSSSSSAAAAAALSAAAAVAAGGAAADNEDIAKQWHLVTDDGEQADLDPSLASLLENWRALPPAYRGALREIISEMMSVFTQVSESS